MANSEDTSIKTFEFKLRLNKKFVEACERELEHSRQVYNAALAERISCYQITGTPLDYAEQSRHHKIALDNLQKQQRRLSRRQKGSKRRAKQKAKVAKAHLKVARCRKDFHHKVSTDLVRRFDVITEAGTR